MDCSNFLDFMQIRHILSTQVFPELVEVPSRAAFEKKSSWQLMEKQTPSLSQSSNVVLSLTIHRKIAIKCGQRRCLRSVRGFIEWWNPSYLVIWTPKTYLEASAVNRALTLHWTPSQSLGSFRQLNEVKLLMDCFWAFRQLSFFLWFFSSIFGVSA